MLRSIAILLFVAVLYPQTPQDWWAAATSSQRAFAGQCIEYGNTLGYLTSWTDNPGETLAGIAWMESSLGRDMDHEEDSVGPFGISSLHYRDNRETSEIEDKRSLQNEINSMGRASRPGFSLRGSRHFERESQMALQIFADNYRYFRRLGYDPREAWFWSYPRYNAGKNWRRFKQRGIIFSKRVGFLKTQFKE